MFEPIKSILEKVWKTGMKVWSGREVWESIELSRQEAGWSILESGEAIKEPWGEFR